MVVEYVNHLAKAAGDDFQAIWNSFGQLVESLKALVLNLSWNLLKPLLALSSKLSNIAVCLVYGELHFWIRRSVLVQLALLPLSLILSWLFKNRDEEEDGKLWPDINPLSIRRPSEEADNFFFLPNGMRVTYEVTPGDDEEVVVFIPHLTMDTRPLEGITATVMILHFPGFGNSDYADHVTPQQLLRLHMLTVAFFLTKVVSSDVKVIGHAYGADILVSLFHKQLFLEAEMPKQMRHFTLERNVELKLLDPSLPDYDEFYMWKQQLFRVIAKTPLGFAAFPFRYHAYWQKRRAGKAKWSDLILKPSTVDEGLVQLYMRMPFVRLAEFAKRCFGYVDYASSETIELTPAALSPDEELMESIEALKQQMEKGSLFSVGSFSSWFKATDQSSEFTSTIEENAQLFATPSKGMPLHVQLSKNKNRVLWWRYKLRAPHSLEVSETNDYDAAIY